MKALLAILLIAVFSMSSFAKENPRSYNSFENVSASEGIKVIPLFDTNISVIDQSGELVFSDMIKKDSGASRTYVFSKFEDGVYTFISSTELVKVEKRFVVEDHKLRVVSESCNYCPVFSFDGEYLDVDYLNTKHNDISISLEDDSYLFFEESDVNEPVCSKRFCTKNLLSGEYWITLKSGVDTYYYRFRK